MDTFEEKRSNSDRRKVDLGPPPGMPERRSGRDRRSLVVVEKELSDDEWERYFSQSFISEQLRPESC